MATNLDSEIGNINQSICKNIDKFSNDERGMLSQNILKNLRDFVEHISLKIYSKGRDIENSYNNIRKANDYVKAQGQLKFLSKFHNLLQKSVSHYTPDEESSERLMLKYYEYLIQIKKFLKEEYQLDVLENINKYPIDTDPALKEYYEKIVERINTQQFHQKQQSYQGDRYYIRKIKPFFINHEVYYEVTFTIAVDNASKFDRVIAFTKLNILPNYSVRLSLSTNYIEVFGKTMPIQIIDGWEVSIRPCELNKFADIFGKHPEISDRSKELKQLMTLLTQTGFSLVDVVNLSDEYYQHFKNRVIANAEATHFSKILDRSRELILNNRAGSNVVKYLLYRLNNKIIKPQYYFQANERLSDLNLQWGCIPFDQMPFVTSLIGHNPRFYDLLDSLDIESREDELFARFIKSNTENKAVLYTSIKSIGSSDNITELIQSFNNRLYHKHRPSRDLENYQGHIYINGYEQDTLNVIKKLKELSGSGIQNYSNSISAWLQSSEHGVDCDEKKNILNQIFESSCVVMLYGSAGTGKTTLISHISNFHKDYRKLYLANTNPAVNNLNSRISSPRCTFKTIASFLHPHNHHTEFDLLVIDECSTVSNSDMIKILNKASFRLLVLVGDVFQIESILFGNWFEISRAFLPTTSVFELTIPYRSNNEKLLTLWEKVRNIEDDIVEHITKNNYSTTLDNSIFEYSGDDEIILCLNYDGLYGINNINKFLQSNNKNPPKQWGVQVYKIGDPILFNESNRFAPLIHNNLKGKIQDIEIFEDGIKFDIEIDKSINGLDAQSYDLDLLDYSPNGKSIVRFFVDKLRSTDDDDESSSSIVPFQVAYAVSIHKAQGLEYKSVKIVITNEIDEMITHNIFYTAITRAKENLKIYWTPETEKKILQNLKARSNDKDANLLRRKFSL